MIKNSNEVLKFLDKIFKSNHWQATNEVLKHIVLINVHIKAASHPILYRQDFKNLVTINIPTSW